ncbi:hypothetical protein F4553_005752 [Allocatelliglobosispora scoriae]|uniref:Uncharacterized protein n=1 Tax=Allocatelliglobosispora scoriae TaxID=643052 RepID=A0A841BXV3_9ACTN|nr:hypothetical protein [Allocatelliglobosispora scoriae]MBB5872318.1 hypothetical protein [Allocatelliglobosispora scoriae]
MDAQRSSSDDNVRRDPRHESDVLMRQLDGHLAWVEARSPLDLPLAQRIAITLRRLVTETARASAADRAKVRAAVHFVVVRRDSRHRHSGHDRHPRRPVSADVPVLNEIVGQLGRNDLLIAPV